MDKQQLEQLYEKAKEKLGMRLNFGVYYTPKF